MDYNETDIPTKPINISWREYYIRLGTNYFKQIPIYINSELIDQIWINKDDTTNDIFISVYPEIEEDSNIEPIMLKDNINRLYWHYPLQERQRDNNKIDEDIYRKINRLTYIVSKSEPIQINSFLYTGQKSHVGTGYNRQ